MSDQQFGQVMGCAGHPIVQTPRLDALAASGTRFSSAISPSPICVPARAAFITGDHVHNTGCWDNAQAYDGSHRGWGHELQDAGVAVESIGKLHFRNDTDPTGFDRQILPMHIAGGIGQVWGLVRDPLPVRTHGEVMVARSGAKESKYNRYDMAVTDAACDWLQVRADAAEPWVLYVGMVAPHFPYQVPAEFFDLYDPDTLPRATPHPLDGYVPHPWIHAFLNTVPGIDAGNTDDERRRCTAAYYGLCSFLDHQIGRILDTLDATGLAERTRVIYTSDHGDQIGSRGHWGKSMPYEPSLNVPLIVSGPGVAVGVVDDTPVSLIDIAPTILESAGLAPMVHRPGDSLLGPLDPDRVVLSQYHAYGATSAYFLVRQGRYKYIDYVGFEPELFDLVADPGELTNLAADPGYADTLQRLDAELRSRVDPELVDAAAKASQARLVEQYGGREAALSMGTVAETPAPEA